MIRIFIMICLAGLAVFILSRCVPGKVTPAKAGPSKPILALEFFSCRGSCPVFHFSIDQNGIAHYRGRRYVDHIGHFQYPLSEEELKSFQAVFEHNDWDQVAGDALATYRDIQRIEVEYAGKNIALHKRAASTSLRTIVELLEQKIEALPWKAE